MKKYIEMTTDQLRKLMRDRGLGPKVARGTWIVHCPKATAMVALAAHDEGKEFDYATGKVVEAGKPELPELPTPDVKPSPPLPPVRTGSDEIDSVVEALKKLSGGKVDKDEIKRIARDEASTTAVAAVEKAVEKAVANAGSPRIHIKVADLPEVEMDRQHYLMPLLSACASVGVHMMLVGPAGSGKTTIAAAIAEQLGRKFSAISFGPTTSEAKLIGYRDANGNYHSTELVRAYEYGHVFLGDEMDSGNAGVLTQTNMALSNGHMSTPEGLKERHKNFLMIAGCNTYGVGANRQYVGRNQLDAATLDRFAVIDFPVDEGLEASFCGVYYPSPSFNLKLGGVPSNTEWFDRVTKVRKAVEKLDVRHVVSPRATKSGAALIAAGVGLKHLDNIVLFKGMDTATRKKVVAESAI
jgi:DNA polymerase III delta prime subunit